MAKKLSAVSRKPSAKKAAAKPAKAAAKARRPAAKAVPAPERPVAAILPPSETLLPIDSIFPSPLNPRRIAASASAEQELEDSIVAHGLLQPIVVRPAEPGQVAEYEIICGARRYGAIAGAVAKGRLAPAWKVPARICEGVTDRELIILAGTENLQRADMHPLDEAALYAALRPYAKAKEGRDGRPEAEIARELHVTERTVFRRLALLRLGPELQAALRDGAITQAQAGAFAIGPADAQSRHFDAYGNGNDYMMRPEMIRGAMVSKAIAFDAAIFPIERYAGEFIDDPDTEKRFFADTAQFARLQNAAVGDRIAQLKKEWPWVKEIERGNDYQYPKAPKGDAKGKHGRDPKAGAIVWLDHNQRFNVKIGVLTPQEAQKRQRADGTGPFQAAAGRDSKIRAHNGRLVALAAAIAESPSCALAIGILQIFYSAGREELRGGLGRHREKGVGGTILALCGALDCKPHELPDALSDICNGDQAGRAASVLREMLTWDLDTLAAFHAAIASFDLAQCVAPFDYAGEDKRAPAEAVIAKHFELDLDALPPAPDGPDDGAIPDLDDEIDAGAEEAAQ